MNYTIGSQIITQDLFPAIYALDVPNMSFNEWYDVYNPYSLYQYGLPSTITEYYDPGAIVTGPQKYEYKYSNSNGVNVVLRGTYNDIMSTVDVLNTYPPTKKECSETDPSKKPRFPLYGPGSQPPSTSTNVPTVGTMNVGNFIHIVMDQKTFSGSGAVIMVLEPNQSIEKAKFILFQNKKDSYEDLGGRIDKPLPNESVDKDTIFKNAKKETAEESMNLFSLTNPSTFVDVESTIDTTFYRVYLYVIQMQNPNSLVNMYDQNKNKILTIFASNFSESYKETTALALFEYDTFMNKLKMLNPLTNTDAAFQTTDNKTVIVKNRTIKAIQKLSSENKITDVINNNRIITPNVVLASAAGIINTITL